jgi:hypothetical protein
VRRFHRVRVSIKNLNVLDGTILSVTSSVNANVPGCGAASTPVMSTVSVTP